MNKLAEEIQNQINFLKDPANTWVPHAPYTNGESCAVIRRGSDGINMQFGYSILNSENNTALTVCTLINSLLDEETFIYTKGEYRSTVGYNDSGRATKQDILNILKATRDKATQANETLRSCYQSSYYSKEYGNC